MGCRPRELAVPRPKLEPLDIKCKDTDCQNGRHSFRTTSNRTTRTESDRCRECGADLVDWSRVERRDFDDVEYTITALEYELIRHHYWHLPIDERAINYARRKGWHRLEAAVTNRLQRVVGIKTGFDGRQTPKRGNPIFYAQHATATCCRMCVEEWHGIPQEQPLTHEQILYLTELCMLYLRQRLPNLTEYGEKVPPIRNAKRS